MEQTASPSVARLLDLSEVPDDVVTQIRVLWGKSAEKGDGHPSLLVTHLLDTAAVAETLWDDFLAPATHSWIDRIAAGDGRRFFAWLCGIHDIGKATPAFQIKAPALAEAVRAVGLEIAPDPSHRLWHHTLAGGALLRWRIQAAGWSDTTVESVSAFSSPTVRKGVIDRPDRRSATDTALLMQPLQPYERMIAWRIRTSTD